MPLGGASAQLVSVYPPTGQVLRGESLAEINGISDGLGSVWLTGGDATHSHVLYAVNPVNNYVFGRVDLPSPMVINPSDVAVGSGAVWVAVGKSVYRIEPRIAWADGTVTRPFLTLPHSGLIGGIVVDAGAVWVTDTTRGTAYRFSAVSGRFEAAIKIGTTAGTIAAGDGGIWVADDYAHTVSRISVARDRVDSVVPLSGAPTHMAASKNTLWITDGTGSIAAVLGRTGRRVRSVRVGGQLTGLATVGGTVWVVNTANGTLSRIDGRLMSVADTVRVGARPYVVAANRRGVWVALLGRAMMDHPNRRSSRSSSTSPISWLERLCGI